MLNYVKHEGPIILATSFSGKLYFFTEHGYETHVFWEVKVYSHSTVHSEHILQHMH